MNVLGIMSGTSLDGIDYILCKEDSKKNLKYVDRHHIKFTKSLKEKLSKAVANQLDFWAVAQLHYDLGEYYSQGLKKIIEKKKWKFGLIGLHGQTVFHAPKKCTFQIGEPGFLKQDFKVPVVSQFRNINVAARGQGAPFAPFFHKALMQNFKQTWAFQNIGGMANVSFLKRQKLYAFDTGPGNVLIDECMQLNFNKPYDKDGRTARTGLPHIAVAQELIKSMGYFSQKPPKTCGRENFSYQSLKEELKPLKTLSPEDQVATLVEFTVLSLRHQYESFVQPWPEILVVSGGGAKNSYLLKRLAFYFPQSEVVTSEDLLSWPVDAIEGGAFAWLALQRYRNQKITDLPTVTGVKVASELGMLL